MLRRDPLANPEPLIRRVYSYVAYRIGPGPDAEDITSETFERALRYRSSFDPKKGEPLAWLIGIARRCADDGLARRVHADDPSEGQAPGELEADTLRRLELREAVEALPERDRELVALRYGADLKAREIAELLDLETNAVEVALHRARARLRASLLDDPKPQRAPALEPR